MICASKGISVGAADQHITPNSAVQDVSPFSARWEAIEPTPQSRRAILLPAHDAASASLSVRALRIQNTANNCTPRSLIGWSRGSLASSVTGPFVGGAIAGGRRCRLCFARKHLPLGIGRDE